MTLFAVSVPMILWYCYTWAVPVIILAALYGLRWKAGMWGNCLSLGAVLFSILVAVGWWEELAELLARQAPITLFCADCIALWAIFLLTLLFLDFATRSMSTIKVKYAEMVENIGNGILLFLLFLALYGFFLFAEDLGPVGEHSGTAAPGDSVAIQMFRIFSAGNLSAFTVVNQFDDKGNFRKLHLQRRQAIMYNAWGEDGSIQGTEELVNKIKRRE